jgi:hypothetical protein
MEVQPLVPTRSGAARQRILATPQAIAPRNVDVWLPLGYTTPGLRFPVLYMHDGQNIFDPADAYGGQSWEVDRALEVLIAAGELPGVIVVGVWNGGDQRWREYAPQKPFESYLGTPMGTPFLAHADRVAEARPRARAISYTALVTPASLQRRAMRAFPFSLFPFPFFIFHFSFFISHAATARPEATPVKTSISCSFSAPNLSPSIFTKRGTREEPPVRNTTSMSAGVRLA